MLLFGIVGLLITGGDEPDCGEEVHALRMELSAALDKLRSSQLEVVRLEEASKVACVICCCSHVIVFCRCLPTVLSDRTASSHSHLGTLEDHRHTHKHDNRTTGAIARSCLGWNRDPESGNCPVAPLTPNQIKQVTLNEEHESVSVPVLLLTVWQGLLPHHGPRHEADIFSQRKETQEVKILSGRSD